MVSIELYTEFETQPDPHPNGLVCVTVFEVVAKAPRPPKRAQNRKRGQR